MSEPLNLNALTLENFEASLKTIVLERGRDYFENDAVSGLSFTDEGIWNATVTGNDDYFVEIRFTGEEISACSCDCPHEVEYCKHIVATLYAIRESDVDHGLPNMTSNKKGFGEMVGNISDAELRQFVIEYSKSHPDFRDLLQAHFSHQQDGGEKLIYAKLITRAAEEAGGGEHFIDYYNAGRFVRDIDKLLAQAESAVRIKHYSVAADIAFAVIENVHEILKDTDDSGGGIARCISDGFGILMQLISADTPFELRDRIFKDAVREAKNPKYGSFDFDDSWLEIVVASADDHEKGNEVSRLIDNLLAPMKNAKDDWMQEFDTNRLIKHKLRLLRKMGLAKEADRICLEFLYLPDLRIEVIEECIIGKDYAKAKDLIREGIKEAGKKNHPGTVSEFKKILLRIAAGEGDTTSFRHIARELYEKGRHMEYYRIIKGTYPKEEWPSIAGTFIDELQTQDKRAGGIYFNDDSRLAEIFIEEKYWERLLRLLQGSTTLHFIDQYAHLLSAKYPREILLAYKEAIIQYAAQNTGRNHYITIREKLRKMLAWEGGREVVKQLVDQFTTQYKGRKAMMDELAKIGG